MLVNDVIRCLQRLPQDEDLLIVMKGALIYSDFEMFTTRSDREYEVVKVRKATVAAKTFDKEQESEA